MGGSKPQPNTIIMPAQTQPQQFQTIIPEKSYKDLAESMGRIEAETGKIQDQRYDEVGTPSEIGARAKGTNMLAAAAYLSSLPKGTGDTSFRKTPRPFDITSTKGAFEQTPGQTIAKGFGGSTGAGSATNTQLDAVRDAAKQNLDNAKKDYLDAVKLAKSKGRPKPTITSNPSFANQDPKDFLPKRYNPETGNMDIV